MRFAEELILPIPVINFLDVLRLEDYDAEDLIYTMEDIQVESQSLLQIPAREY